MRTAKLIALIGVVIFCFVTTALGLNEALRAPLKFEASSKSEYQSEIAAMYGLGSSKVSAVSVAIYELSKLLEILFTHIGKKGFSIEGRINPYDFAKYFFITKRGEMPLKRIHYVTIRGLRAPFEVTARTLTRETQDGRVIFACTTLEELDEIFTDLQWNNLVQDLKVEGNTYIAENIIQLGEILTGLFGGRLPSGFQEDIKEKNLLLEDFTVISKEVRQYL